MRDEIFLKSSCYLPTSKYEYNIPILTVPTYTIKHYDFGMAYSLMYKIERRKTLCDKKISFVSNHFRIGVVCLSANHPHAQNLTSMAYQCIRTFFLFGFNARVDKFLYSYM